MQTVENRGESGSGRLEKLNKLERIGIDWEIDERKRSGPTKQSTPLSLSFEGGR
jgi:hypothetical protein